MKILFLCLGLVFDVNKKTEPYTSGYSYLVRDLAIKIAEDSANSVDCYSKNKEPEKDCWNGINLIKRSLLRILRYSKPFYLKKGIEFARLISGGLWETLYVVFTFLEGGLVEKVIKDGKYDHISIQGFMEYSIPYILACQRLGCAYSVSFHALDVFHKNLNTSQEQVTKWALDQLAKDGIPVSFISERMRERALSVVDPQYKKTANFIVILNGCSPIPEISGDIRKIHNIPESAHIGLCCGNITERKNQVQVVRAYNLLDARIKKDLYFIFVGNVNDANIRTEVEKSDYSDHLILCGPINHEKLFPYYDTADFICIASISEGFGLSAVEGFAFGKPVLMWSDLDAVDDIYDKNAVILVEHRDDEALAEGMVKISRANWSKTCIKEISKKYSISRMASEYEAWFKSYMS